MSHTLQDPGGGNEQKKLGSQPLPPFQPFSLSLAGQFVSFLYGNTLETLPLHVLEPGDRSSPRRTFWAEDIRQKGIPEKHKGPEGGHCLGPNPVGGGTAYLALIAPGPHLDVQHTKCCAYTAHNLALLCFA